MDLSKELFTKALKVFPGGVNSPVRSFKGLHTTPRFIEKAFGSTILSFLQKVEGNIVWQMNY